MKMEFTGFRTEGDIAKKNGLPFTMPDVIAHHTCHEYFAVGDIVSYKNGKYDYRISFVDPDTVKMERVWPTGK